MAVYAGWKDYRAVRGSRRRSSNTGVDGSVRAGVLGDERVGEWEDER